MESSDFSLKMIGQHSTDHPTSPSGVTHASSSPPELKPTDRLVLAALATGTTPLSVAELSEATGSAPTTLARTTRLLEWRGLIIRQRIGGLSNFTLPTTTPATAANNEVAE